MFILNLTFPGAPYTNQDLFRDTHSIGQTESILVLVDIGTNYTLPCGQSSFSETGPVMWDRPGYDRNIVHNTHVQEDGSLFFSNLKESDSGLYSCQPEYEDEESEGTKNQPMAPHSSFSSSKIWFRLKVRSELFLLD